MSNFYVVMIEFKGARWFLRKTGTKFTPTSSIRGAFYFSKIATADRAKERFDRKYPNTDVYQVYTDEKGKTSLFTLDGKLVQEIDNGSNSGVSTSKEGTSRSG